MLWVHVHYKYLTLSVCGSTLLTYIDVRMLIPLSSSNNCLFFTNEYIFCHLKLEIVLALQALND